MRRTGICVLVVLVLLITACSGSGDEASSDTKTTSTALSKQIAELDALPKVPLQGAEGTSDRDPSAVMGELWRLDPCRLLAPEQGKPGRLQDEPHRCTLRIGETSIELILGTPLSTIERKQVGATTIQGTKAYVQPGGGSGHEGCLGWLPVSQSQTIRVEDVFAECWRVRDVLRRVVKRIDDPSSRQSVQGLPAVRLCPLLEHGLGAKMKGRKVEYGGLLGDYGLDHCAARSTNDYYTRSGDYFASLEFAGYDPTTVVDFGAVRGRAVVGGRSPLLGNECELYWKEATADLQLTVKSCAQGRRMVKRMTSLLDRSQGRSAVLRGSLLYEADEDDVRAQGACADYMPVWYGRRYESAQSVPPAPACYSYDEPEVPDDPAEIVIAAEADPNVTCAIAADAVHEEFGNRLRPATLDPDKKAQPLPGQAVFRVRPCVFVDPQRKVQVKVFVGSEPMPVAEELRAQIEEDGPDVFLDTDDWGTRMHSEFGELIGFGDDMDDPGYLAVFAGKRHKVSRHGDYDAVPEADTESVADAIIEEHLVEAS